MGAASALVHVAYGCRYSRGHGVAHGTSMRSSDVSTLFASAVAMIAAALAGALAFGATLLLIAGGSLVVGGVGLLVVSAITVMLVLRRRVAAAKSAPMDLEISIVTTVARTEHVEPTAPTSTSQSSNRGGATSGSAELPASIAHDLRSPLVTVHSYLELLAEESFGPIPTEAREAAQRATVAAVRAQSMVEDTLRQFTVSAATLPLDAPEMSVKAMIERVDMSGLMEEVVVALEAARRRVRSSSLSSYRPPAATTSRSSASSRT
jgi:signal transduction histidine kinase